MSEDGRPLHILIVDDEMLAIDRLSALCDRIGGTIVVGHANDGDEALDRIATLKPDLVLLDIAMPGLDGVGVADALRHAPGPEIVFVTAHDSHAAAAFDLDAADYLLKPVDRDRLGRALDRARMRRATRIAPRPSAALVPAADPDLWVPDRTGYRRVPIDGIDWVEAARDYVLLHTPERSHLLRITMTDLERRLAGGALVRVHRSAFVRPDRVARIGRTGRGAVLVLLDGTSVPVGPSYLDRIDAILGR